MAEQICDAGSRMRRDAMQCQQEKGEDRKIKRKEYNNQQVGGRREGDVTVQPHVDDVVSR